jgi:thiol-disulfide isomerase/thioredoxin
MKNLFYLLFIICTLNAIDLAAQSNDKSLKKGDSFKELKIKDRLGNNVTLSTKKGQLLIIDFWNVNCTGCVVAFRKLDTLQTIFGDSIKIVSVTYHSNEQAEGFFKKLKRSFPAYPVVVSDTILKQLFPHHGDPYYAWIKDGKVLHLSNAPSLTVENVRNVLAGRKVQFTQRLSMPSYKHADPFLTNMIPMKKYCMLLAGLENYSIGDGLYWIKDSISGKPVYLKVVSRTRIQLLLQAFWKDIFGFETAFHKAPNSQIFIDSSLFNLMSARDIADVDEWIRQNKIGFEIRIDPEEEDADLYKEMQSFLLRNFPFDVKLEKKDLPAILIEVADPSLFKATQREYSIEKSKITSNRTFTEMQNISLNESLISFLTMPALEFRKAPYVNNTGYEGPVSMHLNCNIYDEAELEKELRKFGLRLRKAIHPLNTMTIRKR